MSEWLKNTCYPLYLMCCGMWNPLQFQVEVNDIRDAAKAARLAKKPRIRFGLVTCDCHKDIPHHIFIEWFELNYAP